MVGPESGLCREVAFVGRSFIVKNITVVILPGGVFMEVVFLGRWPFQGGGLYREVASRGCSTVFECYTAEAMADSTDTYTCRLSEWRLSYVSNILYGKKSESSLSDMGFRSLG